MSLDIYYEMLLLSVSERVVRKYITFFILSASPALMAIFLINYFFPWVTELFFWMKVSYVLFCIPDNQYAKFHDDRLGKLDVKA